jgi:hypothetical protein
MAKSATGCEGECKRDPRLRRAGFAALRMTSLRTGTRPARNGCAALRGNAEFAGFFYVAVGHAGSVEGGGGAAFAVEQDQATGGVHPMR